MVGWSIMIVDTFYKQKRRFLSLIPHRGMKNILISNRHTKTASPGNLRDPAQEGSFKREISSKGDPRKATLDPNRTKQKIPSINEYIILIYLKLVCVHPWPLSALNPSDRVWENEERGWAQPCHWWMLILCFTHTKMHTHWYIPTLIDTQTKILYQYTYYYCTLNMFACINWYELTHFRNHTSYVLELKLWLIDWFIDRKQQLLPFLRHILGQRWKVNVTLTSYPTPFCEYDMTGAQTSMDSCMNLLEYESMRYELQLNLLVQTHSNRLHYISLHYTSRKWHTFYCIQHFNFEVLLLFHFCYNN